MDTDVIKSAFVVYIVPGFIPQKKGPFRSCEEIEKMLREMKPHYPTSTDYYVARITHDFDLWLDPASEWLALQEAARLPDSETCESGCAEPVVGHDSEGVPLCQACLDDLNKEAGTVYPEDKPFGQRD